MNHRPHLVLIALVFVAALPVAQAEKLYSYIGPDGILTFSKDKPAQQSRVVDTAQINASRDLGSDAALPPVTAKPRNTRIQRLATPEPETPSLAGPPRQITRIPATRPVTTASVQRRTTREVVEQAAPATDANGDIIEMDSRAMQCLRLQGKVTQIEQLFTNAPDNETMDKMAGLLSTYRGAYQSKCRPD